jgi:hypothetical protein
VPLAAKADKKGSKDGQGRQIAELAGVKPAASVGPLLSSLNLPSANVASIPTITLEIVSKIGVLLVVMHVKDLGPDRVRHPTTVAAFYIRHEAARREFTAAVESTNQTDRESWNSGALQTA